MLLLQAIWGLHAPWMLGTVLTKGIHKAGWAGLRRRDKVEAAGQGRGGGARSCCHKRRSAGRAVKREVSNCIQLKDIELYTSCCVERKEREVQKKENGAVFIGKYWISFAGIRQEVSNNRES